MVFPGVMYGCESWAVKKAEHRRIDAFELWCWRRLESPLDCMEIQPVHPKGDQSWVFFGRNDAKAETPVLWPPHVKRWLIGKDSDAGRDWVQEEKGMTENEMAGWHHWLDGRESEWTPGVGDRQGGLGCCKSMGSQRVGHDWATELNWTECKILKHNGHHCLNPFKWFLKWHEKNLWPYYKPTHHKEKLYTWPVHLDFQRKNKGISLTNTTLYLGLPWWLRQ